MNEDVFNTQVRKFLKKLGITAQREIERAVDTALETQQLNGNEVLTAKAVINIPELDLVIHVEDKIALE